MLIHNISIWTNRINTYNAFLFTDWYQRASVCDVNVLRGFGRWGLCIAHIKSSGFCLRPTLRVHVAAGAEGILPSAADLGAGACWDEGRCS